MTREQKPCRLSVYLLCALVAVVVWMPAMLAAGWFVRARQHDSLVRDHVVWNMDEIMQDNDAIYVTDE